MNALQPTPAGRAILFVLAAAALAALVAGASAGTVTTGSFTVANAGETVSVPITLDSAPLGISGFQVRVTLSDPSVAEITAVTFPAWSLLCEVDGTMVASPFTLPTPSNTVTIKGVDLVYQVPNGSTGLVLATLTVRARADGITPIEVTPDPRYGIQDRYGDFYDVATPAGTLNVGNVTPVPTTPGGTVAPTPAPVPVASFTANVTSGPAPLVVHFSDTSTGEGITTWHWTFGDGATSSEQHPVHTYAAAGSYTVTLTVTGAGGWDSEDRWYFIHVLNEPPAGGERAFFLVSTDPAGADVFLESLGGRWYPQGNTSAGPLNVTLYLAGTPMRRVVATLPGYVDAAWNITEYPAGNTTLPVHLALSPASTAPYPSPHVLPGVVQAEDFDTGGEGVAYHDTMPGNEGGAYRTDEGVDIETLGSVTNIGWIRDGEWARYTVTVPVALTGSAWFRVASWAAGRQIAVSVDGVPTATVNLPVTGSPTAWKVVPAHLPLPAGTHVLEFRFVGDGQNLDWVEFGPGVVPTTTVPTTGPTTAVPSTRPTTEATQTVPTADVTATGAPTPVPTTGPAGPAPYPSPHVLPGVVQAEDFDTGGEGVACHDTTSANEGGASRTGEPVDIEYTAAIGSHNIGWIRAGEWLTYTVEVPNAGTYAASFNAANPDPSGKAIEVWLDGAKATTAWIGSTGSFETFRRFTVPVSLPAGEHRIRLAFPGQRLNLDYVEFGTGAVTTPSTPAGGASFSAAPTTAPYGAAVQFRVTPASGKTIAAAWWSFDATAHLQTWNSRQVNPTFFYPQKGTFSPLVKLTYTDGTTQTLQRDNFIRAT